MDESLELYIACEQKLEPYVSMVSDNLDTVCNPVTMKLLGSGNDEYAMAATMVSTVQNSTFLNSSEEEQWMFIVSSLEGDASFLAEIFGSLTLKISYFHNIKRCFVDQSIQKSIILILRKEALLERRKAASGSTCAVSCTRVGWCVHAANSNWLWSSEYWSAFDIWAS